MMEDKTTGMNRVAPYGDTLNDGKVQFSFTLPVPNDERGIEAAKMLAKQMGVREPLVTAHKTLDKDFTFYIIYGSVSHTVNLDDIQVEVSQNEVMTMDETDDYIRSRIGRKIVIIGASTGTDAHTVGIDAIMNMKGYAGHYGLERYDMIDAYNLGSQVTNQEFIEAAIELKADVLMVSQTVTQKDVHIANMTELVELLEAANLRHKMLLIAGGARISNELAKEIGFDAGFGPGRYADDVASYAVTELVARNMIEK